MSRRRVLHLIDSGGIYGAERVILNLSRQMQRLSDIVPVVGCIVPAGSDPDDLHDAARASGIEAVKLPMANTLLMRDLPRAARTLRDLRIDLIHSHGYKASVFGSVVRMMTSIPVMATCHLWFDPASGPLKMRTMIKLELRLYRRFPVVVAVSDPIRDVLIDHGVPRDRTQVVCNGVDIVEPRLNGEAAMEFRRELGLEPGDFCVLNTGRLTRQKAQWLLIEAAARLRAQHQGFRFLIVGEGDLEQELHARIAARGVADCVSLLGFRSDIPQLLSIANAFALPSLDEGMPMSLLEATAARVPVVATAVGDIPKLIKQDHSGLLVPGEDAESLAAALLRLREEPARTCDMARNAFEATVRNHSSEAMCRRYLEIYEQVFSR